MVEDIARIRRPEPISNLCHARKRSADQTESAHGTRLTCRLQMKPYGSEFLWLIRRRKGASRTTPFRCLLPLVFPPKFSIQQGPSRNRFASLQRPYFRQWQGQWRRCDLSLFLTLLLPLSFPRPPPHRTKSPGPYLECAVSLNRDQPPQCPPASLGFATQPQTATPAPATFVLALAVDPDTVWVLRSPAVLVLPQVLAVRSPPSAKVLAAPVFRRELLRLLPISSLWVFARIRWRYFSCERYHFVQNLLGRAAHEVAVSFRCTEMSGGRRSLAANDQNIARRDCAVGGNPDGEVAEVPLNPKGLIAEALTEVFPRRPRGFASATSVAPL